ncbi:hypothetical protein Cgig2_009846 [Carnegiea gigantea]|uniref:Uncharacterized protein n=1 Tax=Carnegiea gigantea TaxID=171969 RepID=A0A9Q1QKR1_9CARY|nr:hypothetical protein Cgig2_009846 [Carnegiea gigantea]
MGPTMTFGSKDMHPLQTPHNDALMIQLKIATAMVRRILMDTGSFVDIIMLECLKKLQYNKKDYKAIETLVVGFGEQAISPWNQKTTYSSGRQRQLTNRRNKLSSSGHPCGKGGKIMQRPKDGKGMLLYESEILRKAPHRRDALTKQDRKKIATEVMVVLSVLVEERGRPCLEPTSEVVRVPLDEDLNDKALREAFDLLSMVRGDVYLREEIAKIKMAFFYNCKVKAIPLRKGDLVL